MHTEPVQIVYSACQPENLWCFSILSIFGAHFAPIHVFQLRHEASILMVFLKIGGWIFEIGKLFYVHVKELARSWSTVQKSSKSVHGARRTVKNKILKLRNTTFSWFSLLSAVKEGNVNIATWKILFLIVLRAPWTDFDDFWTVDKLRGSSFTWK